MRIRSGNPSLMRPLVLNGIVAKNCIIFCSNRGLKFSGKRWNIFTSFSRITFKWGGRVFPSIDLTIRLTFQRRFKYPSSFDESISIRTIAIGMEIRTAGPQKKLITIPCPIKNKPKASQNQPTPSIILSQISKIRSRHHADFLNPCPSLGGSLLTIQHDYIYNLAMKST